MGRRWTPWRSLRASFRGVAAGTPVLLFLPFLAGAQENPNILVLEPEYRSAQAQYDAAFNALVALEGRLNQALLDLDTARATNDEAATNLAYYRMLQFSGELREQRQRVDEKARELREARSRLLRALRLRVDELIAQLDLARDQGERQALAAILEDRNNRRLELLAEEEPETVLEPMRDITISQTDLPGDILRKAATLDFRAEQHEAQLEGIDRRLEDFRQDLRRSRFVSDFFSDTERYGDTRLPVRPTGAQPTSTAGTDPLPVGADSLAVEARPMTLEERIQKLEVLKTELEERIQLIRDKAERFRALARGEVAA